MAITTAPVTMRVNKGILAKARAEAKATNKFYQQVLNEKLAKAFGVTLPVAVTKKHAKPVRKAKAKKAKSVKAKSKSKKAKH